MLILVAERNEHFQVHVFQVTFSKTNTNLRVCDLHQSYHSCLGEKNFLSQAMMFD